MKCQIILWQPIFRASDSFYFLWRLHVYIKLHDIVCAVYTLGAGDEYASRFLIENGADVNASLPNSSQTPLHLAALFSISRSDSDMADSISRVSQLLLQHGASSNAQDSSLRLVFVCLWKFVPIKKIPFSSNASKASFFIVSFVHSYVEFGWTKLSFKT